MTQCLITTQSNAQQMMLTHVHVHTQEFNLTKPTAYAWDQCCMAFFMLISGLLGLPPANGVLPQTPMHSRTLCTMRMNFEAQAKSTRRGACVRALCLHTVCCFCSSFSPPCF